MQLNNVEDICMKLIINPKGDAPLLMSMCLEYDDVKGNTKNAFRWQLLVRPWYFYSFYHIEFLYLIFFAVFTSTSVMVKILTKSFYVSDGTLVCNI